jgi:hypothetical protein
MSKLTIPQRQSNQDDATYAQIVQNSIREQRPYLSDDDILSLAQVKISSAPSVQPTAQPKAQAAAKVEVAKIEKPQPFKSTTEMVDKFVPKQQVAAPKTLSEVARELANKKVVTDPMESGIVARQETIKRLPEQPAIMPSLGDPKVAAGTVKMLEKFIPTQYPKEEIPPTEIGGFYNPYDANLPTQENFDPTQAQKVRQGLPQAEDVNKAFTTKVSPLETNQNPFAAPQKETFTIEGAKEKISNLPKIRGEEKIELPQTDIFDDEAITRLPKGSPNERMVYADVLRKNDDKIKTFEASKAAAKMPTDDFEATINKKDLSFGNTQRASLTKAKFGGDMSAIESSLNEYQETPEFKRDVIKAANGNKAKFNEAAQLVLDNKANEYAFAPTKLQKKMQQFSDWAAENNAPLYATTKTLGAGLKGLTDVGAFGAALIGGTARSMGQVLDSKEVTMLDNFAAANAKAQKMSSGYIPQVQSEKASGLTQGLSDVTSIVAAIGTPMAAIKPATIFTKAKNFLSLGTRGESAIAKGLSAEAQLAARATSGANKTLLEAAKTLQSKPANMVAQVLDGAATNWAIMGSSSFDGQRQKYLDMGFNEEQANRRAFGMTSLTNLLLAMPNVLRPHEASIAQKIFSTGSKKEALKAGLKQAAYFGGDMTLLRGIEGTLDDNAKRELGIKIENTPFSESIKENGKKALIDAGAGLVMGLMARGKYKQSEMQLNGIAEAFRNPEQLSLDVQKEVAKGRLSKEQAKTFQDFLTTIEPQYLKALNETKEVKGKQSPKYSPTTAVKVAIERTKIQQATEALKNLNASVEKKTIYETDKNGNIVEKTVYRHKDGKLYETEETATKGRRASLLREKSTAEERARRFEAGYNIENKLVSGWEMADLVDANSLNGKAKEGQREAIIANAPYEAVEVNVNDFANQPEIAELVSQIESGKLDVTNVEENNIAPPTIDAEGNVIDGKKIVAKAIVESAFERGGGKITFMKPITNEAYTEAANEAFETKIGDMAIKLTDKEGNPLPENEVIGVNAMSDAFDKVIENGGDAAEGLVEAAKEGLQAFVEPQKVAERLKDIKGEDTFSEPIIEAAVNKAVKAEPIEAGAEIADIEKRRQEEKDNIGQKAVQIRLQDLRESTSEKQIAQAIINIEKNVKAGAKITKEEQDFVNQKRQELKDKGFEIIDLTGKIWDAGMNLNVLNFKTLEEDTNLTQEEIDVLEKELENRKKKIEKLKEKGLSEQEIDNQLEDTISIMTTVQPQLNKDGKMVQAAKVDALLIKVSQAEEILERSKKNPKNTKQVREDKINAKYDAELAALEATKETEAKTVEPIKAEELDFTAKGGNKAVDKNGEPIKVFTGTNANSVKDIDALYFESDKTLKEKLSDLAPNYQIFFTDNKKEAQSFGKNVLEAEVLIKNPVKNKADLSKTKSQLLKEGYDGYIWDSKDGRTHYIVFDKSQIKTSPIEAEAKTVEQLRAEEKAEMATIDPNDKEAVKEVYDRYDKLITPLLEKEKAVIKQKTESNVGKELNFTELEDKKIKDIATEANLNVGSYVKSIPTGKKNKLGNSINEYEATNPFTKERIVFKKQGDAADYVVKEIAKATTKSGREEIFNKEQIAAAREKGIKDMSIAEKMRQKAKEAEVEVVEEKPIEEPNEEAVVETPKDLSLTQVKHNRLAAIKKSYNALTKSKKSSEQGKTLMRQINGLATELGYEVGIKNKGDGSVKVLNSKGSDIKAIAVKSELPKPSNIEVERAKFLIEKGIAFYGGDVMSERTEFTSLTRAEVEKGVADIEKGKMTIPAIKLIKELNEMYESKTIPTIQGGGGSSTKRSSIELDKIVEDGFPMQLELTEKDIQFINENEATLAEEYDAWYEGLSNIEKLEHLNIVTDAKETENRKAEINASGESEANVSNEKDAGEKEQQKSKLKEASSFIRNAADKFLEQHEKEINDPNAIQRQGGLSKKQIGIALKKLADIIDAVGDVEKAIKQFLDGIKDPKERTEYEREINNFFVEEYGEKEEVKPVPFNEMSKARIEEVKQGMIEGEEKVAKTLPNRVMTGKTEEATKKAVENQGLERVVDNFIIAEANANNIVEKYGYNEALAMAIEGEIDGAARSAILGMEYLRRDDAVRVAKTATELRRATEDLAEWISYVGYLQAKGGSANAYWGKFYADNPNLGLTLKDKIDKWEQTSGKAIPIDIKEKYEQLDTQLKEALQRVKELEEQAPTDEMKSAIKAIQEQAANKPKTATKKAKEVADKFRETFKSNPIELKDADGNPILDADGKPVVLKMQGLSINELVEVGAKAIEKTGEIIDGVKAIGEKLSEQDWYKNLTQKDKDAVSRQIESALEGKYESPEGNPVTNSLIRDYVLQGFNTPEKLLEKLMEHYPNKSERNVRDLVSKYGQEITKTADEIDREISLIKNVFKTESQLEDIAQGVRPKKRVVPQVLTFAERAAEEVRSAKKRRNLKNVRQALDKLNADLPALDNELRNKLDKQEATLSNKIKDLELAIEDGKEITKSEKTKLTSEEIERLELQLDETRKVYNEVFGKKPMTEGERKLKSLQAQLENLYRENEKAEKEEPKYTASETMDIERLQNEIAARKKALRLEGSEMQTAEEKRVEKLQKELSAIGKEKPITEKEVIDRSEREKEIIKKIEEAKAKLAETKKITEIDSKIAETEKKIQEQDFEAQKSQSKEYSDAVQKKIDALNEVRKNLKEAKKAFEKSLKTDEERRIEVLEKRLDNLKFGESKPSKEKVARTEKELLLLDEIAKEKEFQGLTKGKGTEKDLLETKLIAKEKQIQKLRDRLDGIEVAETDKQKIVSEELDKLDAEAEALRKQIREEKPKEQKVSYSLDAVNNAIYENNKRLKGAQEDLEVVKKRGQDTSKIEADIEKYSKNIETLSELRTGLESIEAERVLQTFKNLAKRKEYYEQRKASGQYAKKPKNVLPETTELTKARSEVDRLKFEEQKLMYLAEKQAMSGAAKVGELISGIWNVPRLALATGEWSFVGMQGRRLGASYLLKNPRVLKEAFKNAYKGFKSEEYIKELESRIKNSPEYYIYKGSGLDLTEQSFKTQANEEIAYNNIGKIFWRFLNSPSFIHEKIYKYKTGKDLGIIEEIDAVNPLLNFERSAIGYLNTLRFAAMTDMVSAFKQEGLSFEKNKEAYTAGAKYINTATGRGSIKKLESFAETLAKFFFSPKMFVSEIQLGTTPLGAAYLLSMKDPTGIARREAFKHQLRYMSVLLGAGASATMLAYLKMGSTEDNEDGTGVEFNPASTNFGKIVFPNNRTVDFFNGAQRYVVVADRLFGQQEFKNTKGVIKDVNVKGSPSKLDIVMNIPKNKLNPALGFFAGAADAQARTLAGTEKYDDYGRVWDTEKEWEKLSSPIFFQMMANAYEQDPTILDGFGAAMAFFGLGYNVQEKEAPKPPKFKKRKSNYGFRYNP